MGDPADFGSRRRLPVLDPGRLRQRGGHRGRRRRDPGALGVEPVGRSAAVGSAVGSRSAVRGPRSAGPRSAAVGGGRRRRVRGGRSPVLGSNRSSVRAGQGSGFRGQGSSSRVGQPSAVPVFFPSAGTGAGGARDGDEGAECGAAIGGRLGGAAILGDRWGGGGTVSDLPVGPAGISPGNRSDDPSARSGGPGSSTGDLTAACPVGLVTAAGVPDVEVGAPPAVADRSGAAARGGSACGPGGGRGPCRVRTTHCRMTRCPRIPWSTSPCGPRSNEGVIARFGRGDPRAPP